MTKITQFNTTPEANISRSVFNLSHTHKTTIDAGYLYPLLAEEVLPGDTFKINAQIFGRISTLLAPIMDDVFIDVHYFFVPDRLTWDNHEKFFGERTNPNDSIDYLVPEIAFEADQGVENGSIHDYLGIPLASQVKGLKFNAKFHRAYNLIYNEWYRNQNVIESVEVPTGDGPDSPNTYKLLKRHKRLDYFTAGLPWPQKGPGVELSLNQSPTVDIVSDGLFQLKTRGGDLRDIGIKFNSGGSTSLHDDENHYVFPSAGNYSATSLSYGGGLKANVTGSSEVVTINSLREAFQMQKLLERDARGGTRYIEMIHSHFGVVSPDQRLQRPEYLGGGSGKMQVNTAVQTADASFGGDPNKKVGSLGAFGVLMPDRSMGFAKSFTEHGVVLGIVSIRANQTYENGLHRKFTRRTRYDHYYPSLAHLGEQAILNKEIFVQNNAEDEDAYAYIPRYDEYRYGVNKITGKLRSWAYGSLNSWHLAQSYSNLPKLSQDFLEENPPIDRVTVVQDEPQFILDVGFDFTAIRPMPTYSIPGLGSFI